MLIVLEGKTWEGSESFFWANIHVPLANQSLDAGKTIGIVKHMSQL